MIDVGLKRVAPEASLPKKAHESDAAYDLFSTERVEIDPRATEIVSTGIALELPQGLAALVMSRSGLAARSCISVLNSPGLIDPGYRGEVKVILHNAGRDKFIVREGDRIAQLMFTPVLSVSLRTRSFSDDSDRGENGIGSTGVGCQHQFIHMMEDDSFLCPRCDSVFSREEFAVWNES
jgi:dUTP pyrophosphatase